MINNLSIKNYALINSIDIEFDKGLSIITGETGAGKSILLGAISLILGQRADINTLKDKSKKCIIEGHFNIKGYSLQSFFEQNDIDYDEQETILRREISPSGKSRAFINDLPVNLNILRQLSLQLVDIHSQHQNLALNEATFQLSVIDSIANTVDLFSEYKEKYSVLLSTQKQFHTLVEQAEKSKDDLEYYQFQFDELSHANFEMSEQETLENEHKTLSNTEEIQKNLNLAFALLSDNQESIILQLSEALKSINQTVKYLPKVEELVNRLDSSFIEIKDISSEIEIIANECYSNPERLNFVSERLNTLYSLQRKHNVADIEGLLEVQNNLQEKINNIESFDNQINKLQDKLTATKLELNNIATELSQKRQSVFAELEQYVSSRLNVLGMPNAEFKISHSVTDEFTNNGKDTIDFLFSANKNGRLSNIAKVASGGEISRLMLSIKSLLSKSSNLPTIIFDEIDTGVSGEIADKMGNIILDMSKNMQVINITHLPQVAAKGNTHYLVYKSDKDNSTETYIKQLSDKERVVEIAKMLSGENVSEQALENAKVLLSEN